jgi:hypothetical protein
VIAWAESKRGGEGRSQRNQKLEIAELNPQRASSSRDFLCRIWYLCWNLTIKPSDQSRVLLLAIRRRTLATLVESRKFSTQARSQLLDSKTLQLWGTQTATWKFLKLN